MLKSMRDGAKSTPMRIFLLALVAGFAMWGIDDVFRNVGSNDTAVEAGEVRISAIEAATEFDRTRRAYLPTSNNAEAIAQGMLGDVLAGLARRAVFSAEAERLGLTVTREMEKNHIANEPAFHDDAGRFSLLRFQDTLARAGLTEQQYLNYIKQDLERGQIITSIADGVGYSSAMAMKVAEWRLERREISYVEVDVKVEQAATPTGAEIDAWYAENSETYNSADLRSITALVLSPDVLLDDAVVGDDELRDAYDAQQENYITQERRALRQLVFANAEEANAAANRIKAGEDFAAVANATLGLSKEDTELGSLRRDDLTDELSAPVFAANIGDLVGPITTPLGQHLLMVDEITASTTISFEDAKAELATNLQREAATDLVYSRINLLEDSLSSGATLEEAAKAAGAELLELAGIDRGGNDIDGNPPEGIIADTKFRQSVWTAAVGDDGFVEETNADTFYVVRVNGEKESAPRPLDDVRDRVIDDMKTERAIATARATAEKIATADDVSAAATSSGLKQITSPSMRRDGVNFDHSAARLIANKAFTLDANESDFIETGEQAVVITVTAITPASGESLSAETDRMQTSLSGNIATSIEGVLANGLTQTHDVTINAAPVQTLLIGQH